MVVPANAGPSVSFVTPTFLVSTLTARSWVTTGSSSSPSTSASSSVLNVSFMDKETINSIGFWVLRFALAGAGIYFLAKGNPDAATACGAGVVLTFIFDSCL